MMSSVWGTLVYYRILRHDPKGQWSAGLEHSETVGWVEFKVFEKAT